VIVARMIDHPAAGKPVQATPVQPIRSTKMRKTLLTSAALLGIAMALPAFAQTATDPTPANPSAVKDGTPAAGTGSGAAPGNDPATSGKTGATLGSQAPSQGPGPMGETANPGPSSGSNSESSMGAPPQGNASSGMNAPSSSTTGDQTPPASDTPAPPRHHSISSGSTGASGRWAHQPGTGESGPASSQASNIDGADTHSTIAPHLPSPGVGENASPDQYLKVAERALRAHKSGEAQQALEMAETRLLDRSTSPAAANSPDQGPRVQAVSTALRDLAAKDWKGAHRAIVAAMNTGDHGGGAMGAGGGEAMGAGVGSGGDTGQAPSGVATTSTTTNVTVQGQGSGYNASTGHPGANPAPLAGTVNSPGTMGAAGVNNPGAPYAPNPSNPGNETK